MDDEFSALVAKRRAENQQAAVLAAEANQQERERQRQRETLIKNFQLATQNVIANSANQEGVPVRDILDLELLPSNVSPGMLASVRVIARSKAVKGRKGPPPGLLFDLRPDGNILVTFENWNGSRQAQPINMSEFNQASVRPIIKVLMTEALR
jgi:hypothetical protein